MSPLAVPCSPLVSTRSAPASGKLAANVGLRQRKVKEIDEIRC
jgi:hypothetical protein